MKLALALLLFAPGAVVAQVRPTPGPGDPHFQTVDYRAEQVTLVEAAPGYQVGIELAPDEKVANIALGDAAIWQANLNRAGNRLFVKLTQMGPGTNMTVITNVREYTFELASLPGPTPTMPYTIRFRYLRDVSPSVAGPSGVVGRYRLSGDRALRPSAISDDGSRTYIQWPADAALPAVYAIEDGNREVLVNGNMRGDAYVIDRVPGRLLFRIDRHTARADRQTADAR